MDQSNHTTKSDYATYIARALATEGGHLAIGRGGATLYFGRGASLSSHDIEPIKDACIAAGLPVIDSRTVDFGVVARLAINGPLREPRAISIPGRCTTIPQGLGSGRRAYRLRTRMLGRGSDGVTRWISG